MDGLELSRGQSRPDGSVSLSVPYPTRPRPRYLLMLTDAAGRSASVTLPKPSSAYRTERGIATVTGAGFQSSSPITVTYHGVVIALAATVTPASARNGRMSPTSLTLVPAGMRRSVHAQAASSPCLRRTATGSSSLRPDRT